VVRAFLNEPILFRFIMETLGSQSDGLVAFDRKVVQFYRLTGSGVEEVGIPRKIQTVLTRILRQARSWEGTMDDNGDYAFDPRTPAPGTHFRANLLIGDRAGFPNPLMTTPKALVDEWGRGSSRSHADKQILATRWDLVPEENGFPANRQFYLIEDGRQIFYSAMPDSKVKVTTRHSANHTIISYEMPDGLKIERTLFIVPSESGLPLAVEAQIITLSNAGSKKRNIQLVATGMFGCPFPDALVVDVIYTCVTIEPRTFTDKNGSAPLIVSPRYSQSWCQEDYPFNLSVVFRPDGSAQGPKAFCLDYRRFIGNGTLERPQNVLCLDNVYGKKGPAFFALALPCEIGPDETVECHSFNGSVSRHEGQTITQEYLAERMSWMASKALNREWGRGALQKVKSFQDSYRSAVQIETPDQNVNRLVNVHLPFQIRYQTYVSRSFALTQKGFRKIGFREIQDLFAALPFEVAAGRQDHIRDLIGLWASHVHRFGYANHQFYWSGFEPGRYSDDALWLFQAVGRYIDLTGDASILDMEWPVAGEEGKKRALFETLQAALYYSGRVSIGKNGLPLIDHADWNDTLNLDGEGVHGPEKEKLYKQQIAEGKIKDGDAFISDLSESVMNGFLLEIARAYMVRFARMKGRKDRETEWTEFGKILNERLQKAWKGDFFARAFLNRPNAANTSYLGGQGDNLSADPNLPGSYFLNSFSWAVLSGVATEEQIRIMFERIEKVLLTPYGLRLASPCKYNLIMPHCGSGDYLYGDRENGAVFKHATMMAANALMQAARMVKNSELAAKLAEMGWKVLQVTAPFKTFEDPYRLAGNPRFCTQYTNPATEEHIGPLLSGTAPWMWMTYLSMLGVQFKEGKVVVDPILPAEWKKSTIRLQVPAGRYCINIEKPKRFVRSVAKAPYVTLNGQIAEAELPKPANGTEAQVTVRFV
jgi:cellobiose phosphorylase